MTDTVLGDGLIDHLGRRKELAEILPECAPILRAGWRETRGCRSCRRATSVTLVMDPQARDQFRTCVLKASPEAIVRLKRLLGVDNLSVYTRLAGKLSVQRL